MKRWLIILVLLFSSTILSSAQLSVVKAVDPKKAAEKAQKQDSLIEQITTDASGLGLGENRAYVSSKLGSMLWKRDPKTASSMFQKAVDELVNAQSQIEAEARNRLNRAAYEARISQTMRPAILLTIAASDAKFALESLYRTRTAAILRSIAQSVEPPGKISDPNGSGLMLARGELNLEQRIMRMAAEQNPETAIKMLLESIKKGLSAETLSLLKKLFEKDPESANGIASDVLDKLNSGEFSNDPSESDNISLATSILTDYIRDKKPDAKELKFNDMQVRSLANKLINFALTQDPRYGPQRFAVAMSIAQKLSPALVPALKKVQKTSGASSGMAAMDPDVRKILDSKVTPSQMLTDARTLSPEQRAPVYQAAALRMAQSGDLSGASGLLSSNFSGVALESALNSLNASYAGYLIGQSKFAEAQRFIDDLPDNSRRSLLINLATSAFKKDPVENKALAIEALRKVRSSLPDRPADNGELYQFMQLGTAYSGIEPDEAFDCLEPVISQLNELADANAVVQAFQNSSAVRSGEFVIGAGNSYGFQFDLGTLRVLSKADFDRTNKLIDGLSRREIRIGLKLQLAESGL